ncbi:unnamed protein product [Adineta ricciae]|uniref:Uncharacterized protein n=1 Tax=Adineta ricciae TaxID=249248 RepID=A0A814X9H4_ADIRI|nr:unnamed protein product [Adineta ricciae]CAF1211138.1 unnamed protein product [Adineta ricciae]
MYAPPPAVAAGGARRSGLAASGPLLAVCCLLFILFLIASTIVLALIPVYLATRDGNTITNSPTYLMTLSPTNGTGLTETNLDSTSLSNIATAAATAANAPSGSFSVNSGTSTVNTAGRRKRRGFGLVRQRRDGFKLYCPFSFNRLRCGGLCDGGAFRKRIQTFYTIINVLTSFGYQNIYFFVTITYSTTFTVPTPSPTAVTATVG